MLRRIAFLILIDILCFAEDVVSFAWGIICIIGFFTIAFPVSGYLIWRAEFGSEIARYYLIVWVIASIGISLYFWIANVIERTLDR